MGLLPPHALVWLHGRGAARSLVVPGVSQRLLAGACNGLLSAGGAHPWVTGWVAQARVGCSASGAFVSACGLSWCFCPRCVERALLLCIHCGGVQLHYGQNEQRDPGVVQQASQQPAPAPGWQASSRCTLDLGPYRALSSAPKAGAASKRDTNAEQEEPNRTSHSTQAMRTTDTQACFKKRRCRVTMSGAGGVVNWLTSPKGCERQSRTPEHRAQGKDTKIQVMGRKKEKPKESNERIHDTQRPPASKYLAQDPRDVVVCPHHPSKRNPLLRRWRLKVCRERAHHPRHRRRRGQRRVVGSLIHSRDAGRHRRRKQHGPHRCTSSTGGLCVRPIVHAIVIVAEKAGGTQGERHQWSNGGQTNKTRFGSARSPTQHAAQCQREARDDIAMRLP